MVEITFANRLDPDQAPKKCAANLFDTRMVFLKEFLEKVDFEKRKERNL